MYTTRNFLSKKALLEAVRNGERVSLSPQGMEASVLNGQVFLEGPHYPRPHSWYAKAEVEGGLVKRITG